MTENSNLRWISSGEAPDLVAVLRGDVLLGLLQRVRGVSPGSVWYVWTGWFDTRLAGPFQTEREAAAAMAAHLGEPAP